MSDVQPPVPPQGDPHAGSWAPPPAPAAPPAPPAPPAAPSGQPAYGQPSGQPAYGQPGGQPAYAAPATNPYGYAAPPPQGGQVSVGSLPYVEHHFGPVAQFGDRILPAIIDALLPMIGVVVAVVGMIVASLGAPSSSYDEGSPALAIVGFVVMMLGFVGSFAIWVWNRLIKQGSTGQSVGKKMGGLKLIDSTTGQPIGAGKAFLRDFVQGLVNQIVYLGYLWMLWDANRLTLGDMVVKSTVIKVPKA